MTALHIRDLPDPVLEALKRRATAHHRSLQGELHAILHEAATVAPPADSYPPLELVMSRARATEPWRREDFYDDRGR